MKKQLQYLAYAAILPAFIGWNWLYFTGGCESPICKILGVYNYKVDNLNDYISYVSGDDFYRIYNASALSFSCDKLRDQLTDQIHVAMFAEAPLGQNEKVKEEIDSLELLGAKRDGTTLHLMNDVTVGVEGLESWSEEIRTVIEAKPKDMKSNWLPEMLRRLFDSIVLHAGDQEILISIPHNVGIHKC